MQFLLIAHDGKDEGALARRLAARDAHIALGDQLVASGNMLYGGAVLDEAGQMTGSVLVLDFPSREDVDAWLKIEPYVLGDVWREIDIQPFRVGPSFVGLHR
ncbi:YciI family protein [Catellatospora sp. NPDC049609]|uniref:YciI family protein n=1 Tax=Catellatospora sp. NPDC049609 TaxID=3155505 RepID=UPI00341966FC